MRKFLEPQGGMPWPVVGGQWSAEAIRPVTPGRTPGRCGHSLLTTPIVRPLLVVAFFSAALVATGCASSGNSPTDPLWPSEVQAAPVVVRQAYTFAHEHADVLRSIPCYCGCGAIGHTSNYACYVAGEAPDGGITYDLHAVGCSICIDITLDAQRMLEEGRSPGEIRTAIDSTYSRYGPSNMP